MLDYYCPICRVIVVPSSGEFTHPDLENKGCLVCPKGHMVYIRDEVK